MPNNNIPTEIEIDIVEKLKFVYNQPSFPKRLIEDRQGREYVGPVIRQIILICEEFGIRPTMWDLWRLRTRFLIEVLEYEVRGEYKNLANYLYLFKRYGLIKIVQMNEDEYNDWIEYRALCNNPSGFTKMKTGILIPRIVPKIVVLTEKGKMIPLAKEWFNPHEEDKLKSIEKHKHITEGCEPHTKERLCYDRLVGRSKNNTR